MVQAGRFDVAYCVGTVTIGRRRSGAACPLGGPVDWGGPAAPPCHRRGPGRRRHAQLQASATGADWGAATLPLARAGRAEHRRRTPVLGAAASCSVAMPPCPPPAAWRWPGRRLLGNKYSVAACWKAALLWRSKWEIDVNGVVGAVA